MHPTLLALGDVVFELQRHRVATHLAVVDAVLVGPAAVRTGVARGLGILGDGLLAALDAGDPQVLQPLQLAALALPVADGVLDELKRAGLAEVTDREDRLEDGLKPGILAVGRRGVNLQEPLVRSLLHLDQVRDWYRGVDLREIHALTTV